MSSIREQILARIVVVLQAAAPVGGVVAATSVYRSREIAINRNNEPAIVLMPQSVDSKGIARNVDKHELEFAIEIFTRGDPWDQLADPIDVAAHAAITGDATLVSLIADLRRIGEAFESQEADRTAGTLTVRYRVTFLANRKAIDLAG